MRFNDIIEARRNPDHPAQQATREHVINTLNKKYVGKGRYFITFSELPKAGINPKSGFKTPIGVYCYPLFAFKFITDEDDFPFASDRRFIYVLKEKGQKLKDVSEYSKADWERDKKKLTQITGYNSSLIDETLEHDISDWPDHDHRPIAPLWKFTRFIAFKQRNKAAAWNSLLRQLGYTGFSDTNGLGIIHDNEPIQAFFLSGKAFEKVDIFENREKEKTSIYYDKTKSIPDDLKKLLRQLKSDSIYDSKKAYLIKNSKYAYTFERFYNPPDNLKKELVKFSLPIKDISFEKYKELVDDELYFAKYINYPTTEQLQYMVDKGEEKGILGERLPIKVAYNNPDVKIPEFYYKHMIKTTKDYDDILRIMGFDMLEPEYVNHVLQHISLKKVNHIFKNGLVEIKDLHHDVVGMLINKFYMADIDSFDKETVKFFKDHVKKNKTKYNDFDDINDIIKYMENRIKE